jgi:hypothetical protein
MKLEKWKQSNPTMQLIVLRMTMEGHFENYLNNIITKEKFVEITREFFAELAELQPFVDKGSW